MSDVKQPTDAERAAFKRSEYERIRPAFLSAAEGDAGQCPTCDSRTCIGRLQYEDCHGSANSRVGGNNAPLDVDRLAKAMRVSLDIYGWDLDAMAAEIAPEYDRLSETDA